MTRGAAVIYGDAPAPGDDSGRLADLTNGAITTAGAVLSTNLEAVGGLGSFREAELFLNVTAAATDVGDTLDVFVDASPDGGTTFINIAHFTQVLGNGGAKKEVAVCMRVAASIFAATTDLAAAATPRPFVGDTVRVRYVVVDANANSAFTFRVTGNFK